MFNLQDPICSYINKTSEVLLLQALVMTFTES